MAWKCTFDNNGTTSASGVTVGQKLNLFCSGETVEFKGPVKIEAEKPEDPPRPVFGKMFILETKKLENGTGEFVITSYQAGEHKAEGIILTDGSTKVALEGFDLQVKSVIENPTQQPYPSFGPWSMSITWYYWVILAIFVLLAGWKAFVEFKKYKVRKKLFDDLQNYRTARPPYDELHTELRKLERGLGRIAPTPFFETLDRAYRLYLIRELHVPALDWTDKDIVKEIKRRHIVIYSDIKDDLIDYFAEMRKIKKNIIKHEDCEFLLKQCQKISDKLSDLLEQVKKSG